MKCIQQVKQSGNSYLSAPPYQPPASPIQDNHLNLMFNMPLRLESRLLSAIYRTAAAEVTSRVPVYSRISNCPTFRISALLHRACKWQCQFSPQQQVRLYLTCTLFTEELQLRLLVCEQRRTSGNRGALMESCNWVQLAQSQIN